MRLSKLDREFSQYLDIINRQIRMEEMAAKHKKSKSENARIVVDLSKPVIGAKPLFRVEYAIIFRKENAKLSRGQFQAIDRQYRITSWMDIPPGGFRIHEYQAIFEEFKFCLPTLRPDFDGNGTQYIMNVPKLEDYADIVFHPSANCPYLLKLFSEYEAGLGGVKTMVYEGKWVIV